MGRKKGKGNEERGRGKEYKILSYFKNDNHDFAVTLQEKNFFLKKFKIKLTSSNEIINKSYLILRLTVH